MQSLSAFRTQAANARLFRRVDKQAPVLKLWGDCRPHRLARSRTSDFRSDNGGSNPPGVIRASSEPIALGCCTSTGHVKEDRTVWTRQNTGELCSRIGPNRFLAKEWWSPASTSTFRSTVF